MFRVGIGDEALCLVAKRELGVAEEGAVGGGDEPTSHFEDGVGGSGLDAGREFLGLRFQFGRQRLGHRNLQAGKIHSVIPNYTKVNIFRTNFRDAYPPFGTRENDCERRNVRV